MNEKVYVITSGCYSDYNIERIFLNKEKAESYLEICDQDFGMEEYGLSDDIIFTPIKYINVFYDFYHSGSDFGQTYTAPDKYRFEICTTNSVDSTHEQKYTRYIFYRRSEHIHLRRHISTTRFDSSKLEAKYKKICQDLKAEIESLKQIENWNESMISDWLNNKQTIIPESE